MGQEIFLKFFDGPQNIFWCYLLILTFSKFICKFKWVVAENVQRKIRDVKQEIKYFELHDNKP